MGDVDQRARRQSLSRAAADVADRDDTRARVEQLLELVQHALFVVDHLQEAQFDAIAPHVAVPGDAVAGMLLVAQDDVVPGPPVDAVGDDVDADCRVFAEHDLAAVGVHRLGHLGPCRLKPFQHLLVDAGRGPAGILVTRPAVRLLDHRLHLGRKAAALEVGVLLRDGGQAADVRQLH